MPSDSIALLGNISPMEETVGSAASVHMGRRVVLLLCAIVLGGYHVFASISMYPVPNGDAAVFLPAAINLKAGRGLTNSIWEMRPDPTGQHRYLDHPALFQMVVAACMPKAEIRSAFLVLAFFNAITLILYAMLLCSTKVVGNLAGSTMGLAVLLLSECALAFLIFSNTNGRPEALSTLILTWTIAMIIWLPNRLWPVLLGIAIGITGAIHPVHGALIACLTTMILLLTEPIRAAIRKIAFAAAVAIPLFWILLSLSPFPVGQVLDAVKRHAVLVNEIDYPWSDLAVFYLKLVPWAGLYLVGVCLVLTWAGIYFWRSRSDRMTRVVRLAALCLTAFAFYFFSIRRPSASYYLSMLAPSVALSAVFLAGRGWTYSLRLRTVSHSILAVFFCILTLCLARDIALFFNYRTVGVSFDDAQKEFDDLVQSSEQEISVSESLWVLTPRFDRIRIVERGSTTGDVMVLQQTQRGSLTPPVIPGYRLLSNHFISHRPTFLGVAIANTMPGYSFAVFVRENSVGEQCQPLENSVGFRTAALSHRP